MTAGRPSDFTEDLAAKICAEIAEGKSLRHVCRQDWSPGLTTVFRWLGENSKFRDQYTKARETGLDAMAEEILDIADASEDDYGFKEAEDKDGQGAKPVFLAEHVNRSRLRVDARKWILAKLAPKKYGDFNRTELTGKDGGPIAVSLADQIKAAHGD